MKTFFEKRDLWKKQAESELLLNPDLMMRWTDDSNLIYTPDGKVTITYPNTNMEPVVFENAIIPIKEFFEALNKEETN